MTSSRNLKKHYNEILSKQSELVLTVKNQEKVLEQQLNNVTEALDEKTKSVEQLQSDNLILQDKNEELSIGLRTITDENTLFQEEINSVKQFLRKRKLADDIDEEDDISMYQKAISNFLTTNSQELSTLQDKIDGLTRANKRLKTSVSEKEKKVMESIKTINETLDSQLDDIDASIELYSGRGNSGGDDDDDYTTTDDDNSFKLANYISLDEFDVRQNVNLEFLPFLNFIADLLNKEPISVTDQASQHAHIIVIQKLLQLFSKTYISKYIKFVRQLCDDAIVAKKTVKLPDLILPQTFQTNSLHYLMNNYNTKLYDPDRTTDIGDLIFNFLKPNYAFDNNKALHLFSPNIGSRYNSILIYDDDTINKLRKLQDILSKAQINVDTSGEDDDDNDDDL